MSDTPKTAGASLGPVEFVALMASLTSLTALSIDAVLPAFSVITKDLKLENPNNIQFIISALFLGLSLGQFIFGPVSDRFGRKPAVYAGSVVFAIGAILAATATSLPMMIFGRLLQGIGASAHRTVVMAIIRDNYAGAEMARILSFVTAVFIIVPTLAPLLGQAILLAAGWRAIFVIMLIMASVGCIWLALRQPETLKPENRRTITPRVLWAGVLEVTKHRATLFYTAATGFIFGAMMSYLSMAQPIFADIYNIHETFPLYFSGIAIVFGIASIVNGRLVRRIGLQKMCRLALSVQLAASIIFLLYLVLVNPTPTLWQFMSYLSVALFCQPMLNGNLNAMSMEPLGHLAGLAATLIGASTTFIALILSVIVGRFYDQTLLPLSVAFFVFGSVALLLVTIGSKLQRAEETASNIGLSAKANA
ncbi:Bicyclomycin resistance protein [Pseudovibrio axinellae]|uniref:Bcr/CflA family efflux transporter n=1 Tax=Pseudovibrio axinellae TaxID=989403 RepID=A0A165ZGW8_9HYPH|nr:multidrug effflux MFS transporter [Pseudovibrio axinellae]KZL19885.1 Bicyclomycin resistance protein [Pseudovibrio axinellae]SER38227.1 MFS transporter, DHA1 family, bicyclomycin/chloramphenicol resistance protein [Pseudovibrio axinellae]